MRQSIRPILSILSLLLLACFFVPTPVLAITPTDNSAVGCGSVDVINTALGCISVADGGAAFISAVLSLSLGIGGGVALLLMLYGFFTLTTSAGMPDKIKASQQTITAAISGLLFIIMSVVLLNLIGIQILNIPGF